MGKIAHLGAAAAFALGSGCAGESLAHPPPSEALLMPDTPVWSTEPLPDVPTDHFAELAATYLAPPPRPIRRSISLGFIGDEPLGRFDPKPSGQAIPASQSETPTGCHCPRVPSCNASGAWVWAPTGDVPSL